MKNTLRIILILLISMPVWARTLGDQFADHKPYEEMTTQKDLQAEVDRIQRLLIENAAKRAGIPLAELPVPELPVPEPASEFSDKKLIVTEQVKPRRALREARARARERVQQPMDEDTSRQFWHYMFREEVAKIEKETLAKKKLRDSASGSQRHSYSSAGGYQKAKPQAEELKEYVIDMPLLSDKPKAERERIKVKMKPGVMPLLRKKHELNKLLVDDVVRLTGKSLK